MKYLSLFILGVIVGFVANMLIDNSELPTASIEEAIKPVTYGDTDKPVAPDSVWAVVVEKSVEKKTDELVDSAKWVIADTARRWWAEKPVLKVAKDVVLPTTIFVTVPIKTQSAKRDTLFWSKKLFKYPYVRSAVFALAATKVDSFFNPVNVDYASYVDDKVMPLLKKDIKKQRTKGRWEGLAVGIIGTAVIVYLVK